MEPGQRHGGSSEQSTLVLYSAIIDFDIAAHPTAGWPAVAAVQKPGLTGDPKMLFVRAYDPHSQEWGVAQQVDIGESSLGTDRHAGAAIAITADDTIVVVWTSDPTDIAPARLWTSSSHDYGRTWSQPQSIATNCSVPMAIAASPSGQIIVLGSCGRARLSSEHPPSPTVIERHADGRWQEAEYLPFSTWDGAAAAIVITGDGDTARAIAVVSGPKLSGVPENFDGSIYLLDKWLNRSEGWRIQQRTVTRSGPATGDWFSHIRGVVLSHPQAGAAPAYGATFLIEGGREAGIYAITTLDNGVTWGSIDEIAPSTEDRPLHFPVPAYDAAANRLVAIWTCCTTRLNVTAEATHFAAWSRPGDSRWRGSDAPIPIVSGAHAALQTKTSQATNSRKIWFAWVEAERSLEVRSFDLNQLIPISEYPTETPAPLSAPE